MPPITPLPVTVPHEELQGSPREMGEETQFRAVRRLKCLWADRLRLFDQLMTGYLIHLGGSPPLVTRIGQPYPHRAGAYASKVQIDPFGSDVQAHQAQPNVAAYRHALLTVDYEPRQFDPARGAGQAGEETLSTSAEFLSLPHQGLNWAVSNAPEHRLAESEAPTVVQRLLEWTYTFRQVMSYPHGWLDAAGSVNSAAITSGTLGLSFAAGTLLYQGVRLARAAGEGANPAWTASLRFTYRGSGWNRFSRRGQATPQPLYAAGAAFLPYPAVDFVAMLNLA
ncbi:MAG: hypothetical protein NTW19_02545 [Planctomycetota bacterium]|nr:hypothetical protein [Planctomycetota bacterium]